jgi:peptidoglycan/LPS O-acetylase OafA/YrhL
MSRPIDWLPPWLFWRIAYLVFYCGTTLISKFFPPFIVNTFFINGGVGVGLLFVTSGLLMASLYPQPASWRKFLQKRYTRIFPLFLTVTLGLLVGQLIPNNLWLQIIIILLLAAVVHVFWIYKIKGLPDAVKSRIFLAFFLLQCAAGIIYFLASHGILISIDFSKITGFQHLLLTGITNMTLTFFLGNKFPELNFVTWSLAAEVLFYILTFPYRDFSEYTCGPANDTP